MEKKYEFLKLLLWIGIVFFVLWFLIFSVAPASVLSALGVGEVDSYFLRLYGIFPLSWVPLFLFALKDVKKNIAIINGGIIAAALIIISIVVFHFVISAPGWFQWLSAVILFIYGVLLFIAKPKAPKKTGPLPE